MNIIKVLLRPPEDDASQEEWKEYWAALREADKQAEESAQRIHELLAV